MADILLLGLFHEATPTAETIGCLREMIAEPAFYVMVRARS